MLESQKIRMHELNRMRAQGMSEDEIRQHDYPFRPAFVNGKRRMQEVGPGGSNVSTPPVFRRPS